MSARAYFFSIFYILVCFPCSTEAGERPWESRGTPYHLKADALSFDDVTKIYRARGHVMISRGDQVLYADAVDFNDRTKDAAASGNARFFSGMDWLTGSRIDVNLEEGTGTIYDGTLFIEKSHFYLRGQEIRKTGKDSYFIKGPGSVTTCDGDTPDWQITGTDLKATLEGYGSVKHAALRVKSIPVLYFPYVVFPAKIKRQSGLLIPMVAYSDKNGFEAHQPFFWAINDHTDATFYNHYMARRGYRHGLEYRYVRTLDKKATFMFDYLRDEQIDDGRENPDDGEYFYEGFRGDSETRENRDRWWLRMKADWEVPYSFTAKLDIDFVSDQDYLREFDSGYSGYDTSDSYYTQAFGRELDDQKDTVRTNQLNLNRTWNQFSLNASVVWNDDVIVRKNNGDDTTLQRLPAIAFSGSKQEFRKTSFYFDLSSSFNHYWRESGTKGYALDANPRVYYPTTLFGAFDLEPSVGFRETVWQVEEADQANAIKEDQIRSREIVDFQSDLSTEISRIFDLEGLEVDKLRHALRPQAVYTYVPDVEQGDLPDFIGIVDEQNNISYGLLNTLTTRRVQQKASMGKTVDASLEEEKPAAAHADSGPEEAGGPGGGPQYLYHELCRLSLSQSYDILKARRPPTDGGGRRPFSDVSGRLELTPFHDMDLDFVGNLSWSPYSGDYTSYDIAAAYKNNRQDEFVVEYRFKKDNSENILGKCFVHVLKALAVVWEHEHNMLDSKAVRSEVGFVYSPQCWTFSLSYVHDRTISKREYLFQISLFGLGEYELGKYRPDRGKDTWMKKG